jgi:predicted transcriptional regulator
MSTIRELRLRAHFSINQLARNAGVDRQTVERAEEGKPVQDVKAYQIVEALSQKLGEQIKLEDIDGLNIL